MAITTWTLESARESCQRTRSLKRRRQGVLLNGVGLTSNALTAASSAVSVVRSLRVALSTLRLVCRKITKVEDPRSRCKKWVEHQFDKHKRLLVYQMIAEAVKRFPLEEGEIMRIIAEVLREGSRA
jgi:hypothetical protein